MGPRASFPFLFRRLLPSLSVGSGGGQRGGRGRAPSCPVLRYHLSHWPLRMKSQQPLSSPPSHGHLSASVCSFALRLEGPRSLGQGSHSWMLGLLTPGLNTLCPSLGGVPARTKAAWLGAVWLVASQGGAAPELVPRAGHPQCGHRAAFRTLQRWGQLTAGSQVP